MIGFAILGIGGAWIYVQHRDRMALADRLLPATALPTTPVAPAAESLTAYPSGRLLDRARVAAAGGDVAGAIRVYQEMLVRSPLEHAGRLELAELLHDAQETELARAHLRLLIVQAAGGDEGARELEDRARELLRQ